MAGEDREESLSELLLDEEGQGEQRSEQGAGPPPEGSKDLPLYKELVSSGAILLYPLIFLEFTQFGVLYPILPSCARGCASSRDTVLTARFPAPAQAPARFLRPAAQRRRSVAL